MKTWRLNPVIDFINTICNYIVLNMVFLITCLPVFTIGAAAAALDYVSLREARGEYGYLVRTYLRELKRSFKTGTAAFLILFPIGGILVFNLLFWPAQGNSFSLAVTGILILVFVVWLVIFHYTFALIGRFVNTPLQSVKNAWGLALRNLKGTLLLLVIDICAACFCLFLPLSKVIMAMCGFGFVFLAYCRCRIFRKIFTPYEEQDRGSKKQSILREHADMMTGTSQY